MSLLITIIIIMLQTEYLKLTISITDPVLFQCVVALVFASRVYSCSIRWLWPILVFTEQVKATNSRGVLYFCSFCYSWTSFFTSSFCSFFLLWPSLATTQNHACRQRKRASSVLSPRHAIDARLNKGLQPGTGGCQMNELRITQWRSNKWLCTKNSFARIPFIR